ncbi:hypothetical protein, partial [Pseudomonas avellanae]|uniref:hypothetical protein n=1 Tax=Pseudomonas avellanae TaxID=46257 RepID=UPI001ED99685
MGNLFRKQYTRFEHGLHSTRESNHMPHQLFELRWDNVSCNEPVALKARQQSPLNALMVIVGDVEAVSD